ncbi:MAG TPA: D-glucuronyl C5-epimerase family protein, partial [Terriglobales bacterium]|nr:D-glucuronyl C5-epimerase family protein [Terriglobales bacterium]
WSLYEQSGTRMMMMASDFYHALHITQLRVLYILTGESQFRDVADRWDSYRSSAWKRKLAFAYKAVFKLFYY